MRPANKQIHFRQLNSWAAYHKKRRPARLIGVVKAPNRKTAIARAVEKYRVPTIERRKLMALRRKPPQQAHSWAVHQIKGRPAKLVGLVEAPDRRTAIARAIKEY